MLDFYKELQYLTMFAQEIGELWIDYRDDCRIKRKGNVIEVIEGEGDYEGDGEADKTIYYAKLTDSDIKNKFCRDLLNDRLSFNARELSDYDATFFIVMGIIAAHETLITNKRR